MAGGAMATQRGKREAEYQGRTTPLAVLACIAAASAGLIFGYDIGISGGVIAMDSFLLKFFPQVYARKQRAEESNYCKYDDQRLQAFTSSLYLAALLSGPAASAMSSRLGRRVTMLVAGTAFLTGATVGSASSNLIMLILARVALGVGVGFGNQAAPLYLSEAAPPKLRGGLNSMFQLAVNVGILCANLVNYGSAKLTPWGWRLSLGLAAVPASLLMLSAVLLPDTPSSLVHRGKVDAARRLLCRLRGTANVDAELEDMVEAAAEAAATSAWAWRRLLLQRSNRPQLVMAAAIPFFQQVTGINVITFYLPVLFQSIGFRSNASLYSAVITGVMLIIGTSISIALVDRVGRRPLFFYGGVLEFFPQVLTGIILALKFGDQEQLAEGYAIAVLVLTCMYVVAFAWSWGPLGWLVPSEIFSLDVRSAAQGVTVSVNMLFTFAVAQSFLSMFCHFRFGIFFFFSAWLLLMTAFVHFLLPETKGIPVGDMREQWRSHCYWKRFVQLEADDNAAAAKA